MRFAGHPKRLSISQPRGAVCVTLGVVLLIAAGQSVLSSGSNAGVQQPSAVERVPDTGAQAADTEESNTRPPCTGWVYVGPERDDRLWAFSVEQEPRSPSAMHTYLANSTIRAKRPMLVREDPYNDFTGTWLGNLIGIDEPEVIGVVEPDVPVYVHDEVHVGLDVFGFGVIWAEIPCPDDAAGEVQR